MKTLFLIVAVLFFAFQLSACTPLVVGGAAAGGAYAGYKFKEEGYSIHITKEVRGKKTDNLTDTEKKNLSK